jgi:hypothetical protein
MNIWRARAAGICLAFVAASAASAAALPNWNVSLASGQGRIVQRVALSGGTLTLDRAFPDHKAHFIVALKSIAKISNPMSDGGTWDIDLQLSAKAPFSATLGNGHVETMQTDRVSVGFLTKSDAAAGRTFLLSKARH